MTKNIHSDKALAPFSCQYTPQFPELLLKLNCSLALSTYQAGKLIFISARDENTLIQLPRHFNKVMGIGEDKRKEKLALACKDSVMVFANAGELALHYPKAPNTYDALYMPRVTYHSGPLDIHDLSFGDDGTLYAVNTLFSCLVKIDDNYNFTPYWTPPFIDRLASEDRCHLNGMAMENGLPKYATAFSKGNTFQSWRNEVTTGGVVYNVQTNECIADGLSMPHSPRVFNGELYVLLSATGELVKIDPTTGSHAVIVKIEGFVRGMSLHREYLFVGLSKLRKNSSTFGQLDFANKANVAGVVAVHLPTGSIAGQLTYLNSLDEIYDVHVLADKLRPNILNTQSEDHKLGLMTEGATFWAKSENG